MKPPSVKKNIKIPKVPKEKIIKHTKSFFWFSTGIILGLFFLIGFGLIYFKQTNKNVVYPGVMVENINFGGKTKEQVRDYFIQKNAKLQDTKLVFKYEDNIATISAKELGIGYDENLLAEQVFSVGRTTNALSNLVLTTQAYLTGLSLSPSYKYNSEFLQKTLEPVLKNINAPAEDAVFRFENGRVTAFKLSKDGKEVEKQKLISDLNEKIAYIMHAPPQEYAFVDIPVKIISPKITSDTVNNLGIVELIGQGSSLFQHSIPNRIYNIGLGASRINGALIAPGEIFSFNKTVGDVSYLTGYKQAYVISGGRTVLGDGGGICQVSTTLFRAVLDAGLPIEERHAHSYRVGYYEEDSPPGLDATVYAPSVDFKFKNDTGNYILIQYEIDPNLQKLTFYLYGKRDGRISNVGTPVITSQSPAPEPLYQDDPTLPKGTIQQVDFAASGARTYFTRTVIKDGKEIINETFNSNYQPWRAVYLRGTKE